MKTWKLVAGIISCVATITTSLDQLPSQLLLTVAGMTYPLYFGGKSWRQK